ncbi:L-fuculose-phosphate aldolase [Anaerotruncus sp. AF02-27]|uniref:L-fuculose-phosphate aldolase n=1 Tax=Anaerotruncus TaxID=244127 RepID=UPI000E532B02|nr:MULTISPECIES: L-fuculose-phosphate aldolase [Anaerotruncus]RGX54600.1 L-fuculose-phosphate aldolase [Anaerotruncus sp. AF02-27]
MPLTKERELVVKHLQKLISHGLTKGTGGNISIFNREEGLLAVSPSGVEYETLTPQDICVMEPDGKLVEGRWKPTSEWDLHRVIYEERPDVNAVVHTHSTYSCILACLNMGIEPCSYLIGYAGGDVRCTRYCTFGTPELAQSVLQGMRERNAVLLGNHGLVACGKDIRTAFDTAEEIEFCAEIYYKAKLVGNPVMLTDAELAAVLEKFKTYGARPDKPAD